MSTFFLFSVILIYGSICWLLADSAARRGGSFTATFVLSLILSPLIGLIIVALSGSKKAPTVEAKSDNWQQLQLLRELRKSGDITEEEYKTKVSGLI